MESKNKLIKRVYIKYYLALVRATLVLCRFEMNPIDERVLDLTVDIIIMSSSPPWNPSTDFTFTANPPRSSYMLRKI
jgi:hypothetical protein